MRYRLDTLRPHRLVKLGVDPHIGGAHRLGGEVDDVFDSLTRSARLKDRPCTRLCMWDGAIVGHSILEGEALLAVPRK